MKNLKILTVLLILIGVGVVITLAARHLGHKGHPGSESEQEISHYTCPMHPHIHEDKPGNCPVCGMKLVPVYKEASQTSSPGVMIPPERQQRIGVTFGKVERKPVTKEIRTVGRVAFDPELAIAQREFLEIAKSAPELRRAAVQRLTLMGMGEMEIRDLEKRGSPDEALTLPEEGGSIWVYATIYEQEIPEVKAGQEAEIVMSSETFDGTIEALDPVVDPMTRSIRARIRVPEAGGKIRPETYLTVRIAINLGEQLAVRKSAVIDTGTRKIVFVVREGEQFEAREVRLGAEAGDDRVVLEGLQEGETVATSAGFLIDSESQLKAAVAGMEGHQH